MLPKQHGICVCFCVFDLADLFLLARATSLHMPTQNNIVICKHQNSRCLPELTSDMDPEEFAHFFQQTCHIFSHVQTQSQFEIAFCNQLTKLMMIIFSSEANYQSTRLVFIANWLQIYNWKTPNYNKQKLWQTKNGNNNNINDTDNNEQK